MVHALVFDTDAPFRPADAAPSPVSPETRLAGLTLLRRAVLMAWKAGAVTVTIVPGDRRVEKRWIAAERRAPGGARVAAGTAALEGMVDPDRVLVLSAQILASDAALSRLVRQGLATGRPAVLTASEAAGRGPALLPVEAVRRLVGPDAAGLEEAVRRLMGSEGCDVVAEPCACIRLDGPEALARADRELYRDLTSITDGYVDRVFNRRISRWCTRRIIHLPITPNHITWFHFTLGLAAAALFWRGGYWWGVLGAVLFQLSVALDCADGEVARLKYQFSRFGSRLDVAADNVVTVAVFAAIARSTAAQYGVTRALILGGLAVTGVLMCVLSIFALARLQQRRKPGQASALAATNRLSDADQSVQDSSQGLLEKVINEATSRDFSVLVVFFALVGRLEWFAWLAALGSHAFWMIFTLVQLFLLRTSHAQTR